MKKETNKQQVENPEVKNFKLEEPENVNAQADTTDKTDYKDLYLRTLADMENLRKNTNKRISEIYSNANEKLLTEMLPFVDALDLAIQHEKQNGNGYEVLKRQLNNILEHFGVKEIIVNKDDQFDESKMNAIAPIQTQQEDKHDTVYEVIKKGYMLNDKVLRYADVIVYMYQN